MRKRTDRRRRTSQLERPDPYLVGGVRRRRACLLGGSFYKSPALLGQTIDINNNNVTQLSFGGDLRFKLDWFQAEALVLCSAGQVNTLSAYLDAGLGLGLSILRLSLGPAPIPTAISGRHAPSKQASRKKSEPTSTRVQAFWARTSCSGCNPY